MRGFNIYYLIINEVRDFYDYFIKIRAFLEKHTKRSQNHHVNKVKITVLTMVVNTVLTMVVKFVQMSNSVMKERIVVSTLSIWFKFQTNMSKKKVWMMRWEDITKYGLTTGFLGYVFLYTNGKKQKRESRISLQKLSILKCLYLC